MNNNDYFFSNFNKYAIEDIKNFGINPAMNNVQLYEPKEGYEKGNLFPGLYEQYKNYMPSPLMASSDQQRMYLEFSIFAFAAHELNLYLDVYPNNSQMIQVFNDYRKKADMLKQEYEKKYGPINISSDSLLESPFTWVEESWPWEGMV